MMIVKFTLLAIFLALSQSVAARNYRSYGKGNSWRKQCAKILTQCKGGHYYPEDYIIKKCLKDGYLNEDHFERGVYRNQRGQPYYYYYMPEYLPQTGGTGGTNSQGGSPSGGSPPGGSQSGGSPSGGSQGNNSVAGTFTIDQQNTGTDVTDSAEGSGTVESEGANGRTSRASLTASVETTGRGSSPAKIKQTAGGTFAAENGTDANFEGSVNQRVQNAEEGGMTAGLEGTAEGCGGKASASVSTSSSGGNGSNKATISGSSGCGR